MTSSYSALDINDDVAYLLYSNLYELILFRGHKIASPKLSVDEFNQYKSTHQYLQILADSVCGLYINNVDVNFTASKLPQMFNAVSGKGRILMVYYKNRQINSIKSAIEKLKAKMSIKVTPIIYYRLMFNFSTHVSFIKHDRCTEDFVTKWETTERVSRTRLPILPHDDPVSVWYGFEPGDIVSEYMPTKNTGVAFRLKQVV